MESDKPCEKEETWSSEEDQILFNYVRGSGEGNWRDVPQRAGLKRSGESCRHRWLYYLKPTIPTDNISWDEHELIIRLHKLLGNRWSMIAGRLPGRSEDEIKQYWNTYWSKKDPSTSVTTTTMPSVSPSCSQNYPPINPMESPHHVIVRPKAMRLTKGVVPNRSSNGIRNDFKCL